MAGKTSARPWKLVTYSTRYTTQPMIVDANGACICRINKTTAESALDNAEFIMAALKAYDGS